MDFLLVNLSQNVLRDQIYYQNILHQNDSQPLQCFHMSLDYYPQGMVSIHLI